MKEVDMIENETKPILKFNAEGFNPADILNDAKNACLEAVDDYTAKHGEPMYCGFANVCIHPARGKLVKFLKENKIGDNGYRGGWRVSYYDLMPKGHQYGHTQSMDIKEEGCTAFSNALKKYGIDCYMESRAD
jgi:hypothetical protein